MGNTITVSAELYHALKNGGCTDKKDSTIDDTKRKVKRVVSVARHATGIVDTDPGAYDAYIERESNRLGLTSGTMAAFDRLRRSYLAANKTDRKDIGFAMATDNTWTSLADGHRCEVKDMTIGEGPKSKTIKVFYVDGRPVEEKEAVKMIGQMQLAYNQIYPDTYGVKNNKGNKSLKHSSTMSDELYSALQNKIAEYDSLEHHGILGQKWGIRRYQNEDGTLTPQGKKRYLFTRVDVDDKGEPKITAFGDADLRRMDLEKQNHRDIIKTLWDNTAFRLGNYLGVGGAATTAGLGLIGSMGLANPAVAAAGMGGSALIGALGYNIGSKVGKKQTGLDDPEKWTSKNLKKYALNTSNLGYDVKWKSRSDLAREKNKTNKRDMIDEIWEND